MSKLQEEDLEIKEIRKRLQNGTRKLDKIGRITGKCMLENDI